MQLQDIQYTSIMMCAAFTFGDTFIISRGKQRNWKMFLQTKSGHKDKIISTWIKTDAGQLGYCGEFWFSQCS